jgi:hypothetical protein
VREDAEIEEVACKKGVKVYSSEKTMKIHMKKSHVETEDLEDNQVQSQTPIESTVLKCDFCSKTSSSLKA